MKIELIEEAAFNQSTMYAVVVDGLTFKWFVDKDEADRIYTAIKNDPSILKPVRNILKSEEIKLSLEK